MKRRFYVLLEWNEDGGGYTATVPSLPGCVSEGDTVEEAMVNAREAIEGFLEAMKREGIPVPDPEGETLLREVEVAA